MENAPGEALRFLLRLMVRRVLLWLLGIGVAKLLIVVLVVSALGWFLGAGRAYVESDAAGQAIFPGGWLQRAERAAAAAVDPNKPEQAAFRLPVEVVGAMRLIQPAVRADDLDPSEIASVLGPHFEYVRKPVLRTERWEVCAAVPAPPAGEAATAEVDAEPVGHAGGREGDDPAVVPDEDRPGGPLGDGGAASVAEGDEAAGATTLICTTRENTVAGEVEVLQRVSTFDGLTVFTYAQETRGFEADGRQVTETDWVLAHQAFYADDSRLDDALRHFGLTPTSPYRMMFDHYLAHAYTDPGTGGADGQPPGAAHPPDYDPGLSRSGWTWPVPDSGLVTSGYGWRADPFGRGEQFHLGLDIGAPVHAPVVAVRDGVVVFAQPGWNSGYGNRIIITLDNGAQATYSHLNTIEVAVGEVVERGQRIGRVGSTGVSTGSHLHFEILVDGKAINPSPYVE